MPNFLEDTFNTLIGRSKTTTSSTTTSTEPSTNIPMVIGGIVIAVLLVGGIVYLVKRGKTT